jgi:hypothetical protein
LRSALPSVLYAARMHRTHRRRSMTSQRSQLGVLSSMSLDAGHIMRPRAKRDTLVSR